MSDEEDAHKKHKFAQKATLAGGIFDKNLTLEKAKFEVTNAPTVSTSTPISPPSPPSPVVEDKPPLTTSVTLPIVTTVSGPSAPITTTMPSQSTPLLTKTTKPKTEDRRNVKRKKLPAMSGTATPSEVFHRNLVDAVSNVEDSDENEQYVYPYSGNNTDTTIAKNDTIHRTTSSSLYRPQSTRSLQPQQEFLLKKASTSFFSDVFRPILIKSQSESKKVAPPRTTEEFRPKLRNYVNGENPPLYNKRNFYYAVGDGGYTTDDEEAQHLLTPRRIPPNRHRNRSKSTCSRFIVHFVIGLIVLILCAILGVMYAAKPLKDLTVEMGRVLSSDKELIFDLRIHAMNSNLWTIHVADADISVFAFSQVVPTTIDKLIETQGVDPAEYLGGFYHFDEPLSFPSSFHTKKPVMAISQIRIKSPGADKSGNERWSRIIRYPYGLVVRGVLKYKPLSVLSPYPQSIAICDVVRVDPNTGKVSEDPDQTFCLTYKQNHTTTEQHS